jgi:hypothetical protein
MAGLLTRIRVEEPYESVFMSSDHNAFNAFSAASGTCSYLFRF